MVQPSRPGAIRAPVAKAPAPAGRDPRDGDRRSALLFFALSAAIVAIGILRAMQAAWVSDDAYISFRYARHLVQGLGLVFNAGERVEGYTNFLWTLWLALGMRLGASPEAWGTVSGVACYAATLVILCRAAWARGRRLGIVALPVAALLAAFHRDWAIFATSGLETSMLTLLVTAGYVVLASGPPSIARAAAAGALLALATLARPDAVLFAAVGGAFVLWKGRPRLGATLACAAAFLVLIVPWAMWKVSYYGDLFPNTYYAKSASLAWYRQGFVYLALYVFKYWVLFAGFAAVLWVRWFRSGPETGEPSPAESETVAPAALAASMAIVFMGYVWRIGGDFMYARMLIPATPFLCVLFELALERLSPERPLVRLGVASLAVVATLASPVPVSGEHWRHGIADEWDFYRTQNRPELKRSGEGLRAYFHGLPIRVAFIGGQAILVDASEVAVAIESETGLTDAFVAHQPLTLRGRPGHEKHAPWPYLIERRRTHLLLKYDPIISESLFVYIPIVPVTLGDVTATALTWDPAIMAALARRGARFDDFPARLDDYLRRMPGLPDSIVARDYEKFRRFYFAGANDRRREAAFETRIAVGERSREPGHVTAIGGASRSDR